MATIRTKLTLLIMAASAMSVLCACLLFYYLIGLHLQRAYRKDLESLADILGHNCAASLAFDVPEDATTVLASIDSRESVFAIRLYDKDGNLFASYDNVPGLKKHQAFFPEVIPDDPRHLKIERPIILKDGSTVGKIVLYDNFQEIAASKKKGILILIATGAASLAAALLLASFLQAVISRPLGLLTEAVQQLAAGDFSARHRIPTRRTDEIGLLSTAFVDMGNKLEDSYSQLAASNQNLEKRVAARTEALQRAMHDLTRSQTQLIQSEKMVAIGHLVAGVAHEINNNINFIACAIPSLMRLNQRLSDQLTSQAPLNRDQLGKTTQLIDNLLHNAEEGVRRTIKIVQDLNAFARPSRGEFSELDIHQELEMVLTLLRYELKGRVEVHRDFTPGLPPVLCLRDQISQVFMNILRNASQAIADQGHIRIQTWRQDDSVRVRFQDSGGGIPLEIQPMIFDPFFTTKDVGKGTGLGLSISYGIVKNHGGDIWVESSTPQGTSFVVSLPLRQNGQSLPSAISITAPGEGGQPA